MRFILPPLRSYQTELVADSADLIACLSSTQVGKTFAYSCKLLARMWEYRGPHSWWWCAPIYRQSKAAQRVMYELTTSAGIWKRGPKPPFDQNPPPTLVLTNGVACEYRTWDNPANLMGDPIAGGVVDEAGELSEAASSAISTRRSFTLGPLWYIGNPGPLDGVFARICDMAEANGHFYRWTWRTMYEEFQRVNPAQAAAYLEFVGNERKILDKREFRRLYEAEWSDWNELPVYEPFDRAVHVTEDAEIQPHLPLELSCDFNVDPMAWVVGQHKGGEVWDADEIVIPGGASTPDACAEFIRRYPDPKRHIVVYGDASGKARDTRSRHTDYTLIRQILGGYYHQLRMEVPNSNPPIATRVNAVNAKLRSASGDVTYRIHPRCKRLIEDRIRVAWKPGTRDIDKTGKNKHLTHASDASDYRIAKLFPVREASVVSVGTPASTPFQDRFIGAAN